VCREIALERSRPCKVKKEKKGKTPPEIVERKKRKKHLFSRSIK